MKREKEGKNFQGELYNKSSASYKFSLINEP